MVETTAHKALTEDDVQKPPFRIHTIAEEMEDVQNALVKGHIQIIRMENEIAIFALIAMEAKCAQPAMVLVIDNLL